MISTSAKRVGLTVTADDVRHPTGVVQICVSAAYRRRYPTPCRRYSVAVVESGGALIVAAVLGCYIYDGFLKRP